MNLETTVARLSLRFWMLLVNLAGTGLALHGTVRYLEAGGSPYELAAGAIVTAVSIVVLSIPNR